MGIGFSGSVDTALSPSSDKPSSDLQIALTSAF